MGIEWGFISFGPGQFRLWRMETFAPLDDGTVMARSELVAEQPEGNFFEALQPFMMTNDEMAYREALARQQDERGPT